MKIVEYRGIEGLVCAEVTEDSAEELYNRRSYGACRHLSVV